MQRLLLRPRPQSLARYCQNATYHSTNHFKRTHPSIYNIYHGNNVLFSTQTQYQSTTPTTTTTSTVTELDKDNKSEEENKDPEEETDEQKNKSFRNRWLMYISGALGAAFIYKVAKSPTQYSTLPADISDQPLSIRSYLFSNILANRALSRICAPWTEKTIPIKWRKYIYSSVGLFWTVDWDEFKPNLEYYATFKQFFIRPLEYQRPLANNDMISPSDGRVLTFGEIDRNNGSMEQIKGVTFKVKQFLYGYDGKTQHPNMFDEKKSNGNKLYYTIIYLAPGDYHRFHAPSNSIKIDTINHIVGDLYPVKPSWLKKIPGLFTLNERIVLSGKWRDDLFFAYVPVGAFNVGSINLTADEKIKTNQKIHDPDVWYKNNGENRNTKNDPSLPYSPYEQTSKQAPVVKKYVQRFDKGDEIEYNKGDEIGYFAFGSTIVLVFEAPNFEFKVEPNQKIRYGDSLGDVIEN